MNREEKTALERRISDSSEPYMLLIGKSEKRYNLKLKLVSYVMRNHNHELESVLAYLGKLDRRKQKDLEVFEQSPPEDQHEVAVCVAYHTLVACLRYVIRGVIDSCVEGE